MRADLLLPAKTQSDRRAEVMLAAFDIGIGFGLGGSMFDDTDFHLGGTRPFC